MNKNLEEDYKPNMANISQNWLKVLVPFASEYNKKFSGSELSRIIKVPQRSVSRYLSELVDNALLKFEIRGKNKFYYLDLKDEKTKILINIIENKKALEFQLRNSKISVIINEFLDNGKGVILFGSYACGKEDLKSDLDLIVFYSKNIDKIKSHYSIDINVHEIKYSEFKKVLHEKNPLSIEILKNHILFGDVSVIIDIFWGFYNE